MPRKARTPAPAPEPIEILPAVTERIEAAQDLAIGGGDATDIFDLGAEIGRIESLDFVATVATAAAISVYENVKKSKAWRFLPNPKVATHRHFESLEEFCEVKLGKSYRRMRELAANRRLIGEEAFEQAERIGLRQVDYNAIKLLPAPQQEMVRRAVEEASSREDVLNILQELAAANAAQLAAAKKREEDLQGDLDAERRRLTAKQSRIDALERERERMMGATPQQRMEREALICSLDSRKAVSELLQKCRKYADDECEDGCLPEPLLRLIGEQLRRCSEQLERAREALGLDALTPTDEEARAEAAEFIAWKAAQDAAQSGGAADESAAD